MLKYPAYTLDLLVCESVFCGKNLDIDYIKIFCYNSFIVYEIRIKGNT